MAFEQAQGDRHAGIGQGGGVVGTVVAELVELTTVLLATLFDFPFEDRPKLRARPG